MAIVVAFAFAIIFALGWLMSQQATQLARVYPLSASACRKNKRASQLGGRFASLEKATDALKDLERELANPTPEPGRRHAGYT